MKNKALIRKRNVAYEFIRICASDMNLVGHQTLPDDVDNNAELLGGVTGLREDLRKLKKGEQNPSGLIIERLKHSTFVTNSEIDTYLIKPFADK
jgi:hypothetical protein